MRDSDKMGVDDHDEGDLTVPDENRKDPQLAQRVRDAIKQGGGVAHVSAKTGIPTRSLSHYLSGRELKRATLVSLADACGVSIEWLATGRGSMRPIDSQSAPQNPPQAARPIRPDTQSLPERSPKLFATVNIDRMAAAMEGAQQAFARKGKRPSWRRFAQVAMLIYDEIDDDGETPDPDLAANETAPSSQDIS